MKSAESVKTRAFLLINWKLHRNQYKKFKETKNLKRSGMAGLFSASLELTKQGLINIMQKRSFDKF